jgi:uncharacterized repeat protein (TIGR02543 family)
MKKIFTLAAAMLFCAGMFAETETVTPASADKADWVGKCATIGDKVMTTSASSGYVKIRTSSSDSIKIKVNEGYKITGLSIQAYSNNEEATIGLTGISYDKGANVLAGAIELPTSKNKPSAPQYNDSEKSAVSTIDLAFDNSNIDSGDTKKKNKQIMAIITFTYEVTATTYKVDYKSNDAIDSTVTDAKALIVAENMFFASKGYYFNGWNTAEDGTGEDYAASDKVEKNLTLFAQWKAYEIQTELYPDNPEEETALKVGDKVLLTEASKAGSISIFSMKNTKSGEESIKYNKAGLSLSGGADDIIRIELGYYLKAGSVIQMELSANESKTPGNLHGLNILALDKKAIAGMAWAAPDKLETRILTYVVKEGDGIVGANAFLLQRNNSVYLKSFWAGELGDKVPTAIDNAQETVKATKVIRNGQLLIEKNGVLFNAQGAVVK